MGIEPRKTGACWSEQLSSTPETGVVQGNKEGDLSENKIDSEHTKIEGGTEAKKKRRKKTHSDI